MSYDFVTKVNRKNTGSGKWEQMYEWNPNVKEDVIPFSVADMELKTAPEIVDGLCSFLQNNVLGYTMSYPAFEKAVIDWMEKRHQYKVKREWIINTPGVVAAFAYAIRAFTQPGDGVVIMSPVYHPFQKTIVAADRRVADCPLFSDGGRYRMNLELFEQLTSGQENKVLLFCSPHNPVGRVWSRVELEALANICLKNNVLVISDEIHNDLVMPGYHHTVFASLSPQIEDRTITCTASSKSFNLAGVGMSNIFISNERMRLRFKNELQKNAISQHNILAYKACEIAYTKGEAWLDALIELIDTNQHIVSAYFEEHYPLITARRIEGTYLQWIDFRALGMGDDELEYFMHRDAQMFFDEGYIFGEEGSGFERINLAAPTKVIEAGLKRLGKALEKVYPKPEPVVEIDPENPPERDKYRKKS